MDATRAAQRARRLLALARSPNEHEAASARAEAGALIQKYKLDEAALVEDDVEVAADRDYDNNHLAVAEAVARATGCRTSGVGWIAFRGLERNARRAAAIYQDLLHRVTEDADRAMRGAPEDAVVVWWTCYVMGFVPAVEKRLAAQANGVVPIREMEQTRTVSFETTTPDDLRSARIEAAAQGAMRAIHRLAELLDAQGTERSWERIDRLRTRAHRAGTLAGQEIEIPSASRTPPARPEKTEKPRTELARLPAPKATRWTSWKTRRGIR